MSDKVNNSSVSCSGVVYMSWCSAWPTGVIPMRPIEYPEGQCNEPRTSLIWYAPASSSTPCADGIATSNMELSSMCLSETSVN